MHKGKWIIALSILLFEFASFGQSSKISGDTLILVNGEPITKSEFIQFSQIERANVIQHYRNTFNLEFSEEFWNTKCDGKSPKELLIERTIDTLVSIKIQQIIAEQKGLIDEVTYSSFLDKLTKENLRRAQAKQNNNPIYGPIQYGESVYFNYLFSNMVIRLKEKLNETDFKITDEKVAQIYEQERKLYAKVPFNKCKGRIRSKQINQLYYGYVGRFVKEAKIIVNTEKISLLEFK
jgi:hypothetical protein